MRLLSPLTLEIVSNMNDAEFKNATISRKTVISHAWSECLKFLATKQIHPKMYLDGEELGQYMAVVKYYGDVVGCNLNAGHLMKYDEVYYGFAYASSDIERYILQVSKQHFDDIYLFSDAISLYFKGLNIMPHIYGDDWRRYVPIENLKEIHRVVGRAIGKE